DGEDRDQDQYDGASQGGLGRGRDHDQSKENWRVRGRTISHSAVAASSEQISIAQAIGAALVMGKMPMMGPTTEATPMLSAPISEAAVPESRRWFCSART